MNPEGIRLSLMLGLGVPTPPPPPIPESLNSVEVTHKDEGRSGFQLEFNVGRSGPTDLVDYPLLMTPLLRPCSRVLLTVTLKGMPKVLMDGIITDQQLSPSEEPGGSTLTVTGEDVSIMMDLEEKSVEHPAQNETVIAAKIIGTYALYGMIPAVMPPPSIDYPIPTERTPVQQDTDLEYLRAMASRYGYVFYVIPGPVPFSNTAYWGPSVREDPPQKALSVNMGPSSNVDSIRFQYDGLSITAVVGDVQDNITNLSLPVKLATSLRRPLASQPALRTQPFVRTRRYRADGGLSITQALARAQGMVDDASDPIHATGELDALRYGDLLMPRALVDLRGAGYSNDGTYYVKSVTHTIKTGEYKQRFTLTREGIGALSPVVRV